MTSSNLVIKSATLVNEGHKSIADVQISQGRIERIDASIDTPNGYEEYDALGLLLIPGMIDDQVHFREPGLTPKADIGSESRAAIAGGITSVMEMPNVMPPTTSMEAIYYKQKLARLKSYCNYAFYLGATEDNIEDIKTLDTANVCGVKVFMGASTGNLLVESPEALERIFKECPTLIATHCESGPVIRQNRQQLPQPMIIFDHPKLRDEHACFASSAYAVALAHKHQADLHVLHLTTAKELPLFDAGPIATKKITAEACVHHLWFDDRDYEEYGNLIKCNPAIKSQQDRAALLKAIRNDTLDIIATDHAPHLLEEKEQDYEKAPAGIPLVQHALLILFELVKKGELTVETLVQKTAHNPAIRFKVKDRGFIREGYFADLVLVDTNSATQVSNQNMLYKCQWTPFHEKEFSATIKSTWVNGIQMYSDAEGVRSSPNGKALEFVSRN